MGLQSSVGLMRHNCGSLGIRTETSACGVMKDSFLFSLYHKFTN
jgi:hypothetical protein